MYDTTNANVSVIDPAWIEFKEAIPADWNLDKGVTVAVAYFALEKRGDEMSAERRAILEEVVEDA